MVEWLVTTASTIPVPVQFHGGQDLASGSVRTGWAALRAVLRSWGIQSPEQLSQWLRSRGFPVVRPGHHISARAQEYLLHEGCTEDARVALLETVFVLITLHLGRTSGVPPPTRMNHTGSRGAVSRAIPTTLPLSSWESLDEVSGS